jgi:hypothetical protein
VINSENKRLKEGKMKRKKPSSRGLLDCVFSFLVFLGIMFMLACMSRKTKEHLANHHPY